MVNGARKWRKRSGCRAAPIVDFASQSFDRAANGRGVTLVISPAAVHGGVNVHVIQQGETMHTLYVGLLSLGLMSSPATAATISQDNAVHGGSLAAANPLNLIQQWTMPVTVNQAVAIGVNSSNIAAFAESQVISVNETTIFTGNLTQLASGPDLAGFPWLLPFLSEMEGNLPQLSAGQPPAPGGDMSTPAPVPVPAALPLLLAALAGMGLVARRTRKAVPA